MIKSLFQVSLANQIIGCKVCRKAAVVQSGIVIGNVISGCGIVGICMRSSTLVKLFIQPVFYFGINQRRGDTNHYQSRQYFKQNKTFVVIVSELFHVNISEVRKTESGRRVSAYSDAQRNGANGSA